MLPLHVGGALRGGVHEEDVAGLELSHRLATCLPAMGLGVAIASVGHTGPHLHLDLPIVVQRRR